MKKHGHTTLCRIEKSPNTCECQGFLLFGVQRHHYFPIGELVAFCFSFVLKIVSQKRFISSISVFFVAFGIQNPYPKFKEMPKPILFFFFKKKRLFQTFYLFWGKGTQGEGFFI